MIVGLLLGFSIKMTKLHRQSLENSGKTVGVFQRPLIPTYEQGRVIKSLQMRGVCHTHWWYMRSSQPSNQPCFLQNCENIDRRSSCHPGGKSKHKQTKFS